MRQILVVAVWVVFTVILYLPVIGSGRNRRMTHLKRGRMFITARILSIFWTLLPPYIAFIITDWLFS
jgi:hypothetical protein